MGRKPSILKFAFGILVLIVIAVRAVERATKQNKLEAFSPAPGSEKSYRKTAVRDLNQPKSLGRFRNSSQVNNTQHEQIKGTDAVIAGVRTLLATGQTSEATNLLLKHMDSHPRDDALTEEMAMIQLRLRHFDEAEVWLRRTLDLDPRNEVALGELTELLTSSDRSDEAISTLKILIDSCGESCPAVNLALGTLLARSGDFDQAIREFTRAAATPSLKGAALQNLALAYAKIKDTENTARIMTEIITMKRSDIKELKGRGIDVRVLEDSLKEDTKKPLVLSAGTN